MPTIGKDYYIKSMRRESGSILKAWGTVGRPDGTARLTPAARKKEPVKIEPSFHILL